MDFLTVLIPLLFALSATLIFILLPLYVYPASKASAWSSVTTAIAAYPKVQWQVIININGGPGLNRLSHVRTLGYIDTAYAKRDYSTVATDINVYANWAHYTQTKDNTSMAGIFLDDVVDNTTFTNAAQTYYLNVSKYAYAQIPSDHDDSFEGPKQKYQNDTTIENFPRAYLDQSAIIMYDATATTNVNSQVHTMAQDGVEAVYLNYGFCTYKGSITGCYNQTNLGNLE